MVSLIKPVFLMKPSIFYVIQNREFDNEITYDANQLYFKKEKSKFNDFNVRITCMIPRSSVDDEDPDRDDSMYIEQITRPAKQFDKYNKPLCMKYEKFPDRSETLELDIYIKVFLIFLNIYYLITLNSISGGITRRMFSKRI